MDAIKVTNQLLISPFGEEIDVSNGNYFICVRLKDSHKWECNSEYRNLQLAREHALYAAKQFGYEYFEDIKELDISDDC